MSANDRNLTNRQEVNNAPLSPSSRRAFFAVGSLWPPDYGCSGNRTRGG